MATRVNFLPWRQQRRRRFWRFWCLLLIGSVLVTGLVTSSLYALLVLDGTGQCAMQDSNTALLQQLMGRQQQLLIRQQQAEALQVRERQRTQTRRWRQTLVEVAERLPARIWLTQLEFRQGILMFTGYSQAFSALGQLDVALRDMPGFRHGKVGKTRRDERGRLQFHYQLNREQNHVIGP